MKFLRREIKYYHIYVTGYKITHRPMSLDEIKVRWGSIRTLESNGFLLMPVKN